MTVTDSEGTATIADDDGPGGASAKSGGGDEGGYSKSGGGGGDERLSEPGSAEGVDEVGPRMGMRFRGLRGAKARVRATCPEDEVSCRGRLAIRLDGQTLGSARFRMKGGDSRLVVIRLPRDERRRPERAGVGDMRARAVDKAGNSRVRDRLPSSRPRTASRGRRGGSRATYRGRGMDEPRDRSALEAMSEAVLAIAAEHSVDAVLQRLVEAARGLAGARYAAIGVPDGEGAFERFITAGMSDELVAEMGPLPRTHGLLGAMLEAERPHRSDDIRRDPRFRGWWPSAHPQMRSFLGVPIVARGGVIGAFYLTDKEAADAFDEDDERLIEMLAAHAAVAIENARLFERSRELSIVEERNRVARELHDSVTQRLFGVVLAAETAGELLDRDPAAARAQLERAQELAHGSMEELRSLIFELRPAALADEGLAAALRKHIAILGRVHDQDIALRVAGTPRLGPAADSQVFRIAQEAVNNALRHANARHIAVGLEARNGCVALTVEDDGAGFDPAAPALRARRLGLTSMEERAKALGGTLTIDSRPAAGTRIRLEVAT